MISKSIYEKYRQILELGEIAVSNVYMATLGQYELVLFVPPIKSSKSELFISFNMEFKLKTSENYLKSI